jgi:hypothetical protein
MKTQLPRYFFLLLPMLLYCSKGHCQENIYGIISDKSDGSILPGVSVHVKGTKFGTVTDLQGWYSLTANEHDTIVFSYVGYLTHELVIQKSGRLDVKLKTDCNKCFFDDKQLGLYFRSGLLNTPIGGQVLMSFPNPLLKKVPALNQSVFGTTASYQRDLSGQSFLQLKTGLYHLFVHCDYDFDLVGSYQRVAWDGQFAETLDIEVFTNLSPLDIIIGYSRFQHRQQGEREKSWETGATIGAVFAIGKPFYTSVLGKVSFYRDMTGYSARATRRIRRLTVFLDYLHIQSFNELSLGLGYVFSYHRRM